MPAIRASLVAQLVKNPQIPGEGIGYTLQYSWASLVAQLIKNPRAIQETWVRSLGWEDPLEKGTATHYTVHGVAKSQTQLSNFQSFTQT